MYIIHNTTYNMKVQYNNRVLQWHRIPWFTFDISWHRYNRVLFGIAYRLFILLFSQLHNSWVLVTFTWFTLYGHTYSRKNFFVRPSMVLGNWWFLINAKSPTWYICIFLGFSISFLCRFSALANNWFLKIYCSACMSAS